MEAQRWERTIFSRVLYQLSYLGLRASVSAAPRRGQANQLRGGGAPDALRCYTPPDFRVRT